MNKLKQNESGFSAVEVILVLVIIVLLGVVGWFVYKNQKKTTTPSTTNTSTTKPTSTTATPTSTSTQPKDQNVIKLQELGIQITVPDTLKDLTYTSKKLTGNEYPESTLAYFSTQALTAKASACSSSGGNPPLGWMAKTPGQYPKDPNVDNSSGTLVKQFQTYYIAYRSPGMGCFEDAQTNETARSLMLQLQSAYSTIKEL